MNRRLSRSDAAGDFSGFQALDIRSPCIGMIQGLKRFGRIWRADLRRPGRYLPRQPTTPPDAQASRRGATGSSPVNRRTRGMTSAAKRRISRSNGWNCSMKVSTPRPWNAAIRRATVS